MCSSFRCASLDIAINAAPAPQAQQHLSFGAKRLVLPCCQLCVAFKSCDVRNVCRSFDRPHKLQGTGQKQPNGKLDLASALNLPDPASSERSMHSAFTAATAPGAPDAEGEPAMGLQQATQSDQPLHSSADKQQVQAALGGEIQSQPLQAVPAVNAAASAVLAASTDAEVADGKVTHPALAHLPDIVKHAGAETRSQPDSQKGERRMSDAPPSMQSISDCHQGPGQLASASQQDQKLAVASTDVQGPRHRAGTPSGNRQALQHQQHPRRRREFHDEPQPSGPGRKRTPTPEVEFGRDAKRSRHAWHPTPAHAEHHMPSQGAPRYDAHRGPSSFSSKQGNASLVAPSHRYRDSQSPTPRSAGCESVPVAAHGMAPAGRRGDTTRCMSISPSHANSRNPLPGHLHGRTAPHGRTCDPEVHYNSRGNAPQTSFAHPPRFDRQQDHQKASWSSKEYSKASLLPREDSHHKDRHNDCDRRSRSTDRATPGRSHLPILDSLTPTPVLPVTRTCQEPCW